MVMARERIALTGSPDVITDSYHAPGTDELNLAEFPLSIMGKRPEGVKTLEFSDTVFDKGANKEVTRKLTVTGSDLYGLPGESDEDVLVVLMHLTNTSEFKSPTVNFSRYKLIELLGWSHGGKSYERLKEALHRWLGVTLYYEKAWWDKKHQSWVNQNFHILSSLTLYDKKNPVAQDELPLSSFTWNEHIFDSFLARNTKPLNLNDYFNLTLAPAKRMYRFLDKRFGARRGNVWTFNLREFACEHIGFSRGYDSAQLKRKMRPSIEELEENGFLKPMDETERFLKGAKRGEQLIVMEKSVQQVSDEPQEQAETKPAVSPLEAELIAFGVTATVAAELVAQYSAEQIKTKIDVLAWMIETKDKRAGKNPAGYLVKSIKDDYAPPAGYQPKADREKKKLSVEERKAAEQARRRLDENERAALKRERAHIEQQLGKLSAEEKKSLEERALAAAGQDEQERAQNGLFAETMRRLLVDRQVLKECPLVVEVKSVFLTKPSS